MFNELNDPSALQNLQQRLAAWFAQCQGGLGEVRVTGFRTASQGFSNLTLMGQLQGLAGAKQESQGIVLRLQPPSSGLFADADVALQYQTMQRLAGTSVPVPQLLGLEPDASVLGAPFYVMALVPGQVPNENPLYHLEGWLHDLPVAAQREHWFSGINTLAAVSRVDWRACGFAEWLPPAGTTPTQQLLSRYHQQLLWTESLARPYPALHAAHRWLLAHQPADEPIALSWGDAKLGNCVFRDGRVAAALDWEMATLANPVADLAWWLVLDESLCTGYGLPRLKGLPTREETVQHWEAASGHSARDLPFHEVFACWRFAVLMARIGELFMQRGLVPREHAMDVNNGGATLLALLAQRHGI